MASFNEYKDLVEIGHGGMATVYRATAPTGNLVALKLLAFHLADDPTARTRFVQESNLQLNHPNIVRIVDTGVEQGSLFIAMDYVAGQSLERKIAREGVLTPQQLAPILTDTANALDYAHSRKVIHRDVKPSNILLRRIDNRALLGDFGVAKSAWMTAFTATTARVGSVYYMSPEQANGALEITAASDIYSLGVTAYYALTGRHPFEGDNEIAVARMHIDTPPWHVSDFNPRVPRHVGNVVMQALEKDPARRPQSAGQFAQAFSAAVNTKTYLGLPPIEIPVPIPALITLASMIVMIGVMVGLVTSGTMKSMFTRLPTDEGTDVVQAIATAPAIVTNTPKAPVAQAERSTSTATPIPPTPTPPPTSTPTPQPTDTPDWAALMPTPSPYSRGLDQRYRQTQRTWLPPAPYHQPAGRRSPQGPPTPTPAPFPTAPFPRDTPNATATNWPAPTATHPTRTPAPVQTRHPRGTRVTSTPAPGSVDSPLEDGPAPVQTPLPTIAPLPTAEQFLPAQPTLGPPVTQGRRSDRTRAMIAPLWTPSPSLPPIPFLHTGQSRQVCPTAAAGRHRNDLSIETKPFAWAGRGC